MEEVAEGEDDMCAELKTKEHCLAGKVLEEEEIEGETPSVGGEDDIQENEQGDDAQTDDKDAKVTGAEDTDTEEKEEDKPE